MKWYYLNTGFNTGRFNMDLDISLAKNCAEEVFFRLYRWKPYCISLGANQKFESIDLKKAYDNNIDVVKRPTGGKAILHAQEMTYSVIYPLDKISSLRNFYSEINMALREGLILYNDKLSAAELESDQPDMRRIYREHSSEICFAVSARNEIKYAGKKLIGSAQRKINNAVLQHGSLLCGNNHKRITEFLNLSDSDLYNLNEELSYKTTELEAILNNKTNYEILESAIMKGFENYFNIKFEYLNREVISLTENFNEY